MFVPSHNEKLIKSSIKSNADVLLLDVEDSVQPLKKETHFETDIFVIPAEPTKANGYG